MKSVNCSAAIAAASMFVLAVLAAGCSDDTQESVVDRSGDRDSASVEARERQIEEAAARHGVDLDVELDAEGKAADRLTLNHAVAGHRGQYGNDVELPEDFPEDVSVPEGLTLFSSSTIPGGFIVQGRSSEQLEGLKSFFQNALAESGWDAGATAVTGPIHQMQFESGNRKLGVTITDSGTERIVQISTMELPQG